MSTSAEHGGGQVEQTAAMSLADLKMRVRELEEAVAARDTFIAVAAHELRNPMMPIVGQLDLLLSALRTNRCPPAQVEPRVERIQQAVRQYMKRAVVLLDVSRINGGNFRLDPVPCDLSAQLRQLADEFAAAAAHAGVAIEVVTPDRLIGQWDRLAVEQVVDNLLSNAIKYGARSTVHLTLTRGVDEVRIEIRDHGKGIPVEHRRRVFERFERAVGHDEYRSGFGVGLWVVGQLVAAMRGRIDIEDAPGGGALFTVILPHRTEVNEVD